MSLSDLLPSRLQRRPLADRRYPPLPPRFPAPGHLSATVFGVDDGPRRAQVVLSQEVSAQKAHA